MSASTRPTARPLQPNAVGESLLPAASSEKALAAHEVLLSLARASRSYLIYDPRNDAVRGFLEALRNTFKKWQTTHGELPLDVERWSMSLEGEKVYEDRDPERSLAFRLYRDGVRKLIVGAEAEWSEVSRLLEVLSIRYVGLRLHEEDVVTLLWKAGFANIRVEAVEGFDPLAEDGDDEDGDDEDGGGGGDVVVVIRQDDVASQRVPSDFDLPLPVLPPAEPVDWEPIDESRRLEFLSELDSSRLTDDVVTLCTELMDLASDSVAPLPAAELAPALAELRDFLLAEAQVDALLGVADGLYALLKHRPELEEMVGPVVRRFDDIEALRRVLRGVPHDADEPPAPVRAILERQPGDRLELLMDLLDDERNESPRRVLRNLIQEFLPARGVAVALRFKQRHGAVAADLLQTLARGAPDIADGVAGTVTASGDADAQHELLSVISSLPDVSRVRAFLVQLLRAADETVRRHALDVVASLGERGAFSALVMLVEGESERATSEDELAAIGRTIAAVDPARALERFREWSQPKGLWKNLVKRAEVDRLATVAAYGLAALKRPEASEILEAMTARASIRPAVDRARASTAGRGEA